MNDSKESKTITEVTVTFHSRKQIHWSQIQNNRSEDRISDSHIHIEQKITIYVKNIS